MRKKQKHTLLQLLMTTVMYPLTLIASPSLGSVPKKKVQQSGARVLVRRLLAERSADCAALLLQSALWLCSHRALCLHLSHAARPLAAAHRCVTQITRSDGAGPAPLGSTGLNRGEERFNPVASD